MPCSLRCLGLLLMLGISACSAVVFRSQRDESRQLIAAVSQVSEMRGRMAGDAEERLRYLRRQQLTEHAKNVIKLRHECKPVPVSRCLVDAMRMRDDAASGAEAKAGHDAVP